MASSELAELARTLAVMVRVHGPDPKGLKMRGHAFHQYSNGQTTLSASGMLLPETLFDVRAAERLLGASCEGFGLVMTVASVIEPFLTLPHRQGISQSTPQLIDGTQIDVLFEGKFFPEGGESVIHKETVAPLWIRAQILKLVNIPVSALGFQSLVQASPGTMDMGWEIGWSLASYENVSPSFVNYTQQVDNINKGIHTMNNLHQQSAEVENKNTGMAILAVSLPSKDIPSVTVSSVYQRGDFILAVGSPFGILSPLHFLNSLSKGSIANCHHSRLSDLSLLLADIRCLPGMEGGPIFSESSELIGILIRPLKQRSSGAEIQLVIPWKIIAIADSDILLEKHKLCRQQVKAIETSCLVDSGRVLPPLGHSLAPPVENTMHSICLITIDDGVWASGVLLNDRGLILTNAHLLEPRRFGKVALTDGKRVTGLEFLSFPSENWVRPKSNTSENFRQSWQPLEGKSSMTEEDNKKFMVTPANNVFRRIRVRLDHVKPWIWLDATVKYVSKGPLDVALLQLEPVPPKLVPIEVDFASPSSGLLAYVVGHGLFGPKCGFYPSVTSGVVAKVVAAKRPLYLQSCQQHDRQIPVMLETTAVVHPGGSGGAVINSSGQMIGLVTSNTKHAGGTVIPHLNFSIPSAALSPIFEYAKDMHNMSHLEILDQPNEELSLIWALVAPVSPKNRPHPHFHGDRSKQEKGSKFAKFISERNDLVKSIVRENGDNVYNRIVPSKL